MTAEAIVTEILPAVITLDDLAAMNHVDTHGRRYEISPEGVLSVVPPPPGGHAVVGTRLTLWLCTEWPAEQVMQTPGLRLRAPEGVGGRIPDLVVWSRPQPEDVVWYDPDDVVLIVEIVSKGSEAIDRVVKVAEYAAAGIPQYWMVARDVAQTVTMHRLTGEGAYEVSAKVPLAWLLQTKPADHGLN